MRFFTGCLLSFILITGCNDKQPEPRTIVNGAGDSATRVRTERDLNPYAAVDVSPMDMSYYPVEYTKLKMSGATKEKPVARVIYSRPHLSGRELFSEILSYDTPWRLGANEATEIEFYRNVTIQGKAIAAGRYILYCIPQPEKWTIIMNSNVDTWGLKHDSLKDLARFDIPVLTRQRKIEYFTMVFERTGSGTDLLMAWDRYEARLPIRF